MVAAGSWSRLDARDLRATCKQSNNAIYCHQLSRFRLSDGVGIKGKITADVEMAEMGALGDQFQDADVAHLGAASHFDMSQFGASATQRLQSSVR